MQKLDKFLHKNENVLMQVRQSYLSSISPDTIVLTNKRVIIIHNSFWGLYTGKNVVSPTKVSNVMLNNIMGTTNTTGKILTTVEIRIRGSEGEGDLQGSSWHIEGIRTAWAQKLSNMIGDLLENKSEDIPEVDLEKAKSLMENTGSNMIWLGIETPEYISYTLGIDKSKIIRLNPIDITSMSGEGLKDFEGDIIMCYNGKISYQISAILKNEYDIKTFVIKGGLLGIMKKEKR